jgi:hypothetical protein
MVGGRKSRKQRGGNLFFDYFTKHGREQRLIRECAKKNDTCVANQEKCDCTVGFGLERWGSDMYCKKKVNMDGAKRCVTPDLAKVGTGVDTGVFWYDWIVKPLKWRN